VEHRRPIATFRTQPWKTRSNASSATAASWAPAPGATASEGLWRAPLPTARPVKTGGPREEPLGEAGPWYRKPLGPRSSPPAASALAEQDSVGRTVAARHRADDEAGDEASESTPEVDC
jgi:hypothetical protein